MLMILLACSVTNNKNSDRPHQVLARDHVPLQQMMAYLGSSCRFTAARHFRQTSVHANSFSQNTALCGNQHLMKPPHEFGSHLAQRSSTPETLTVMLSQNGLLQMLRFACKLKQITGLIHKKRSALG